MERMSRPLEVVRFWEARVAAGRLDDAVAWVGDTLVAAARDAGCRGVEIFTAEAELSQPARVVVLLRWSGEPEFVEPDVDHDGFGDESQDQCPTEASKQGDRTAPETTITKGAPKKTKKHTVKFKFKSSEPGSSFECKLDKKKFKPCKSPKKLKRLKKGKHKFKVRAIDPAGNTDPSPAKDKFKVVR